MTKEQLLTLYNGGILLVPTRGRGKYLFEYSKWRQELPDPEEYINIWESHEGATPEVLCGVGNIISIDVDEKSKAGAVEMFEDEVNACLPGLLNKMYIEQTASGGRHYWFIASDRKSEDLAHIAVEQTFEEEVTGAPVKYKPIVEYKGFGSLCRVFPSEGIHVVQGSLEMLTEAEKIPDSDIAYLKYICSLLTEKPEPVKRSFADSPRTTNTSIEAPGADFNERCSTEMLVTLLEEAGWKVVRPHGAKGRVTLRRPGAKTNGVDGDILNRVFANRSSSVSEFEPHKGYSPFAVYAILKHGGDFRAAATALKSEGFGRSIELPVSGLISGPAKDEEEWLGAAKNPLWEKIEEYLEEFYSGVDPEFSISRYIINPGGSVSTVGVLSAGLTCLVAGRPKARKTSFVTSIVASTLTQEPRAGWISKMPGKILFVDTEQPLPYSRSTVRRIAMQVKLEYSLDVGDRLIYLPLTRIADTNEKLQAIELMLEKHPDISIVIVDVVTDLVTNFNDEVQSNTVGGRVRSWSNQGGNLRLLILLMHLNKLDRNLQGHFGSYWSKKCDVRIDLSLNPDTDDTDVDFPLTRGVKPDPYSFSVVGNNIPVIKNDPSTPAYPFIDLLHQPAKHERPNPVERPTEEEINALYDEF